MERYEVRPFARRTPPPRMCYLSVQTAYAEFDEGCYDAHEYTLWKTEDGGRNWEVACCERTDETDRIDETILKEIFKLSRHGFVFYRGKYPPEVKQDVRQSDRAWQGTPKAVSWGKTD